MVDEGAKVVIGQRNDAEGQAMAEELGPAATFVHLDVTQPAEWETAVATTVKTYGTLNVLVNNAGIATYGPIDEYRPADWDATIAVDLTGVFHGIQAAIPALKQAGAARSSTSPPSPACGASPADPATSPPSSACAG